jgi:hypothetical protein
LALEPPAVCTQSLFSFCNPFPCWIIQCSILKGKLFVSTEVTEHILS